LKELLKESGLEDYMPARLIAPENYHPNWEWLEEYRETGDTALQDGIAGTHFYGVYRPKENIRNKFIRFTAAAKKQNLPMWHTEIHTNEEGDDGFYPNDMRLAEDVVNQVTDYGAAGYTGFVHWAYPLDSNAPKNTGHLLRMEFTKMACVGCHPVLSFDQDGPRTQQGLLNTGAWCKGNSCRLWMTNVGDDSQAIIAKDFRLGAAAFAKDHVAVRQWTLADDCTDGKQIATEMLQKTSTAVAVNNTKSFTLDLPRESWTIIEFDIILDGDSVEEVSTTVTTNLDTYLHEYNQDKSYGNYGTVRIGRKSGNSRVALFKFDVQAPDTDYRLKTAMLTVRVTTDNQDAVPDIMAFPASSDWDLDSTWASYDPNTYVEKNAVGAAVGASPGAWVEIPVTNAVTEGIISIALMSDGYSEFKLGSVKSQDGQEGYLTLTWVAESNADAGNSETIEGIVALSLDNARRLRDLVDICEPLTKMLNDRKSAVEDIFRSLLATIDVHVSFSPGDDDTSTFIAYVATYPDSASADAVVKALVAADFDYKVELLKRFRENESFIAFSDLLKVEQSSGCLRKQGECFLMPEEEEEEEMKPAEKPGMEEEEETEQPEEDLASEPCKRMNKSTCKETNGCVYSYSGLSRSKCKKKDWCDHTKKHCSSTADLCVGMGKSKCRDANSCSWSYSGLSKSGCKQELWCDHKYKYCSSL